MVSLLRFPFSLALAAVAGSFFHAVAAVEPPERNLVVAGGGSLSNEVLGELLTLSGKDDPRVLVIPHATTLDNLETRGAETRNRFLSMGISQVDVLDVNNRPAALASIQASEAIWMPGGSQSRLMAALENAGLVKAIRERAAAGVPVGGSSAGAAVMSNLMLAGGFETPSLSRGLGLWPEVVVDQHFTERDRLPRLETVIEGFPGHTGIGIDERTAVVVRGDRLRVAGPNNATLVRFTPDAWPQPEITVEVLGSGEEMTLTDAGPTAAAEVPLHEWRFEDSFGTGLADAVNSVNPGVSWSGNLADSATTGTGVFRIRRNASGLNRRADISDSVRIDKVRMIVEIAGWYLPPPGGSQPFIRFDFMNGMAADLPSEVTAGFRLNRQPDGAVTLQAVANGTASPGAQQSAAEPLFGSLQTEPLAVSVVYDRPRDRYEVSYRVGDGPWEEFFTGNTSGVREALSFRMFVSGDFSGGGAGRFDLDRFAVNAIPEGLGGVGILPGSSSFNHLFTGRNVVVPVWTYLPPDAPEDPPIVIVCHGMGRNASGNRNSWRQHADRLGFLVVAPEFTDEDFPGSNYYNLANMRTSGGSVNPQSVWTFQAIEDIFDDVVERMGSSRDSYHLYGHSAGSQFVHRMLWFMPAIRVDRAVMANAGWYTMPEISTSYPHGFGSAGVSLDVIRPRLAGRHLVLLGTEDNDPDHPQLCGSSACNAQGPHRFARGNTFYDAAEHFAGLTGTDFGWSLGYVPGVGHSNAGMAAHAANWLFGDWSGRASLLHNLPGDEYRQDFSTGLPADADNQAGWLDNTTFPGWSVYFANGGTPSSYRLGNTSAPGSLQHWRAGNTATQGVLGGRASETSGDIHHAVRLTNNTGGPLFGFTLGYTGAQFYNANTGVPKTMNVSWRIGPPANLAEGEWTTVPELAFTTPQPGSGTGSGVTLNPFSSANRVAVGPVEVGNLFWPEGAELWIRWTDPHVPNADHGVAIDNVLVTASAEMPDAPADVPPPGILRAEGGQLRLELPVSHPGHRYQLQTSVDLSDWEEDGPPLDGVGTGLVWEREVEDPVRFYRVIRTR